MNAFKASFAVSNEFGAFRENKSVFVQDAIVFYLEHKKKEMKQMLLDKASKL
ncbi:hypothetical protein ID0181_07750 [Helicobacter pylori]